MRRILLAMAVAALMAVMAASSAAAQEGEPVGSCPPSFDYENEEEGFTNGLVTTHFLLGRTGNLDPNREPDPSMDPNGDGWTCLKIIASNARGVPFHSPVDGTSPPEEARGARATWHDNNL
jgi:hypothetical protein